MGSRDCIQESRRYIEKHLEEGLSVDTIANHVGYSKYHFSRMFRERVGMPVMDYVRKRRLCKASRRIAEGEKIIDVALSFGWQSHAGFVKAFRNEYGFPPSLLRAMLILKTECGGVNMGQFYLREPDCHAGKDELYAILVEECGNNKLLVDYDMLERAYRFACQTYTGISRHSGDEYVTHPLNVAILLANMGADGETVMAGLFADAMQKTGITRERLEEQLPEKVVALIAAVNGSGNTDSNVLDSVQLVKLAGRLHNMRTLKFMDEARWREKAKETYEEFVPVAQKLGNEKLMMELNDLSLEYL